MTQVPHTRPRTGPPITESHEMDVEIYVPLIRERTAMGLQPRLWEVRLLMDELDRLSRAHHATPQAGEQS